MNRYYSTSLQLNHQHNFLMSPTTKKEYCESIFERWGTSIYEKSKESESGEHVCRDSSFTFKTMEFLQWGIET